MAMARCTASASATRGPRERVIDGRGFALGQRLLHDHVDHRAVLGVHADERAVLRRLPQRLEDRGVVDHQHVGIGHEELEAGHALADHVVHVFEAASPRSVTIMCRP